MKKSTFTSEDRALRKCLIEFRKKAGLTQRQLAKKLGRVPSVVAFIELGQRRLDVIEFFWYCQACGVDPAKAAMQVFREFQRSEQGRQGR